MVVNETFLNLKGDIRNWAEFSYYDSVVGCFMSHYSLWKESVRTNKRVMILEHDAHFIHEYEDGYFDGILNIGQPLIQKTDGDGGWKTLKDGITTLSLIHI